MVMASAYQVKAESESKLICNIEELKKKMNFSRHPSRVSMTQINSNGKRSYQTLTA
jgi:hypothetical protein